MSLKFGLTIGAIWTGAGAFTASEKALKALKNRVLQLNQKKLNLKGDSRAITGINRELGKLDRAITRINSRKLKLDQIAKQRQQFKSSLMEKALLAGAVIAPLKVAVDFESAMADVKKVVNFDSNAELKTFQNEITKLSQTIPLSARGLAEIVASGGQLGINKDKLLDFTRTTAKMATAFDMLPTEAGDASAKLMNVFGLNVQGVGRLGDAINHLSDNSAAKASQIVNVLGRIGGQAKVFGLSAKQSASLAGALLALGKPPEVAATSINALLLKLGTADKQGARFQDALAGIGLSAAELKADISQNGEGAIIGFLQRLNTLDSADKMGVLADLFGAEYADDLALLSGGIDNYQKSIGLLANAEDYAGSMQREFEARSETTANQLGLLGNSVSTIAINIGSLLLPAVNALLQPLRVMSNWIGGLAQRCPALTTGVAGLVIGITSLTIALSAAAYAGSFLQTGWLRLANVVTFLTAQKTWLSAATWIAGAAAKGVAVWHKALGLALGLNAWLGARLGRIFSLGAMKTLALGAAAKVAAAGQWILNAALSANPIGLLIKGVALLAAGAVWLYKKFEPFTLLVNTVWKAFKGLFSYISEKWQIVGKLFSKVTGFLGFGEDEKDNVSAPRLMPDTGRGGLRAAAGAGMLATQMATATPDIAVAAMPAPPPALMTPAAARPAVTQHITVQVTVNNPADNVDIERAILDTVRQEHVFLMDEDKSEAP